MMHPAHNAKCRENARVCKYFQLDTSCSDSGQNSKELEASFVRYALSLGEWWSQDISTFQAPGVIRSVCATTKT